MQQRLIAFKIAPLHISLLIILISTAMGFSLDHRHLWTADSIITKMILFLVLTVSSSMLVGVRASFNQYKTIEVNENLWQPLDTISGTK